MDDIDLDVNTNGYVDVESSIPGNLYRCYIIVIGTTAEDLSTLYNQNNALIANSLAPAAWKETNGLQIIPVNNINTQNIEGRTNRCIREAQSKIASLQEKNIKQSSKSTEQNYLLDTNVIYITNK